MEPAWRESFERFYADMGPCPEGCTLDRLDNDGPYSNANCQWSTSQAQSNNRRDNQWLTFEGRTLTLSQWARDKNIPMRALHLRLIRYGWTVERALTQPVRGH